MENASKALVIAGAILISILIIGLGVFIFNGASSTVKNANLNSQEAMTQNNQFEQYFGDRVSATNVKALMSLVRSNNITANTGEEEKIITVIFGTAESTPNSVSTQVKANKTYKVGVDDTDDDAYYASGFIKKITITEN